MLLTPNRPGIARRALALGILVAVVAGSPSARAGSEPVSPQAAFIRQTLDEQIDRRDALAQQFNPVQLPLIAASLESAPDATIATGDAYDALARWYFWQGRRWDTSHDGLWQVEASSVPVGIGRDGTTLAAHASLELVQLAALARMAASEGHYYDALTWWADHDRLQRRLNMTLFDPLQGAYSDLDSLQTRVPVSGVSALIPLAVGAPSAGPLTRDAAWRLWTGLTPEAGAESVATPVQTLDLADSFHGWSPDAGLRLFDAETTASLALHALARLHDPRLTTVVRHAFQAVGIATSDSVTLHVGDWTPRLGLDALDPRPFERSRVAVELLHRAGVLTDGRADSLLTRLDPLVTDGDVGTTTAALTDLYLELRGTSARMQRHVWASRRERSSVTVNGEGGVFHLRWEDQESWYVKSQDLLLTDILQVRTNEAPQSLWSARFDPPVVGRGDETSLLLSCSIPDEIDSLDGAQIDVLWTDGRSVIGPEAVTLRKSGLQQLTALIEQPPVELGLWTAVLEGRPAPVRRLPVLPVVQPLRASIRPVARDGRRVTMRARIESHVQEAQRGRIDLEVPLSWNVEPAASATFELASGGSTEIDFFLSPEKDESPGLYPIRWHLFDRERETLVIDGSLSIPFAWLHLGPVPASHEQWIASEHATDRRVDLAERYRGPAGTVGWRRMPTASVSADGWIELAAPSDPFGLHYAYTAFTTNSREATIRVESAGAVEISVDGHEIGRVDRWGGEKTFETAFHSGINHVLVKVVGGGGRSARFRLDVRDIDSQPLRVVGNALENLLDAYAYLARTGEAAAAAADRQELRLVSITYRDPGAQRVAVVGSFNGWSPNATPMTPLGDGRWQAKIRLRPGRFEYKIAIEGQKWIVDPNNPEAVSDGFGGRNSVLVVE